MRIMRSAKGAYPSGYAPFFAAAEAGYGNTLAERTPRFGGTMENAKISEFLLTKWTFLAINTN